jgi:TRAP-type mannitol/chloroaromatic compound transport system permease large subunit
MILVVDKTSSVSRKVKAMNQFVILYGSAASWAHQSVDGEDMLFEMLAELEKSKVCYQAYEIQVGKNNQYCFVRIF